MEVRYFLKQRLQFIRQLYSLSTAPYVERKRKIEAGEEPFTASYYDESGEPPYLEEWLETEESLQVLGRACISMLASTLHVYFKTCETLLGVPIDDSLKKQFKKGWLNGYKEYFSRNSRVPFDKCPVNFDLLEELVLARNRVQHPEWITTDSTHYSASDLKKLKHPFFVDQDELERLGPIGKDDRDWLISPAIRITPEKFEEAVTTIEAFADWLETGESPVNDQ